MTYRKKVINYRGVEPAPTTSHRRTVTIIRENHPSPEWETVISCDKCQGYFSCVFRGRPCFMPGLLQFHVDPAVVRTQANNISIELPERKPYDINRFIQIVQQVIKDKKR